MFNRKLRKRMEESEKRIDRSIAFFDECLARVSERHDAALVQQSGNLADHESRIAALEKSVTEIILPREIGPHEDISLLQNAIANLTGMVTALQSRMCITEGQVSSALFQEHEPGLFSRMASLEEWCRSALAAQGAAVGAVMNRPDATGLRETVNLLADLQVALRSDFEALMTVLRELKIAHRREYPAVVAQPARSVIEKIGKEK